MSQRDVTVLTGSVKEQTNYFCILTGRPCNLRPVTLRRMIILPPFWIGWRVVVSLPLEKDPLLAFWQYARMLRPYVVIFGVFMPLYNFMFLTVDPKPGSLLAI